MKLFLVINETRFYVPDFAAGLLAQTPDDVVGAALVTKVPPRNSYDTYLRRHFFRLRPLEIARLGWREVTALAMDRLGLSGRYGRFYSVRSVLEHYQVPTFEVRNSINKQPYLDQIRALQPDVILSCSPLIFKDEILRIPRLCCLNRHSALLPAYGGIWPVFHAVRNGEPYTGVTIHTMERQLDKGLVLTQRKVPIHPGATIARLYEDCFRVSVGAMLEALDKIRRQDFSPGHINGAQASYYSFPTAEHWNEFRERAGRFI